MRASKEGWLPNYRTLDDVWQYPDPALPHVLLVVDQFPRALGGGERTVLRLAELLPRYGYRASVLTFAIHPESAVLSAPLTFPLYLLPLTRTYDFTALRAAWALGRFLRRQRVAIVQTFFESSDLWAGSVAKALSSARLIWSRRDMGILRSGKHHRAYRLLSSMPDLVFAVSDRVGRHCVEVDGVEASRVRTIYNGLDLPRPKGISSGDPGRFAVTTIGNIRRVKGHDLLIRAAAIVLEQFPHATFSIAGEVLEPDYFAELAELVRSLGISDRFRFVGSTRDAWRHLEEADLFVLPSRSEGFSNAILEAMAASLPVIATDVGGNAEAVLNEVSGFIIEPESVSLLAHYISRLAGNRSESRRMGAAGRARVEEKFSTCAMMQKVTEAYQGLTLG